MGNNLTREQIEEDFQKYKQQKKEIVDRNLPIKYRTARKITCPIQRGALYAQRKIKQQTVEVIGNKNYKLPKNRGVTFVVSHIGKYDFEIVKEQIKQQFYVMASDYRNMHGNFNEAMMEWFGVIYVDELSKEDRLYSSKLNKKMLLDKLLTMILSEGTWNLSPNEIIMDTHLGAVDGAMSTNSLILPIAIEQYGDHFVVNFGELYDPSEVANKILHDLKINKSYNELDENDEKESSIKEQIKLEANTIMRDKLATLKWEIWEAHGVERRDSIPEDYWFNFIEERIKEWPGYSMQEQIDSVDHTKQKRMQEEDRDYIKIISKLDPFYFGITNDRFQNYMKVSENIDEYLKSLREFRESLPEDEPIQKRLERYKSSKYKI